MSVEVEKLDGNMAKLTIKAEADKVDEAIKKAYGKIKNQISLPGFRKGKVPQYLIEKAYGPEVFYDDAANFLINDSYYTEIESLKDLDITSSPDITVEQIEKGKEFIYSALVAVKPEVTLGEYKGLEYTKKDTQIPDEEVDKEIERQQKQNAREVPVEDRPAKEGDIVVIDFDGSVNGKRFKGGKSENYSLTLGSHTFIEGFEDQIAGHSIGDEFDVNVKFPKNYGSKELAGKDAVFKCRLNEIKEEELPALDDEFASEVSEFETLDEYRQSIKKNLGEKKEKDALNASKNEIAQKAAENATIDVPQVMIDEQADFEIRRMEENMKYQGFTMDQYLKMLGMTREQLVEHQKPMVEKNIRSRLTLEAIAKAEGIEASEEEIEEKIKDMAETYRMDLEKLKETLTDDEKDDMKKDICLNRAAEFLVENGVAVEPVVEKPEEIDATADGETKTGTKTKKKSGTKKETAGDASQKKPAKKDDDKKEAESEAGNAEDKENE